MGRLAPSDTVASVRAKCPFSDRAETLGTNFRVWDRVAVSKLFHLQIADYGLASKSPNQFPHVHAEHPFLRGPPASLS